LEDRSPVDRIWGLETTIIIERMAYGGAGVGRLEDGRVCFVHGTLPGERVLVHVYKAKKNFAEGDLLEVLEASPRRIIPRCRVFGECGGCSYQHVDYAAQLEFKTSQVSDVLKRIGGLLDVEVHPMIASPLSWGYRNRISVHAEGGRIGFYHKKSHSLVDVKMCPIASEEVNAELNALRDSRPRQDCRITLREPHGSRGFSQVNNGAAALLADVVEEFAGSGQALVDAYCGAGFFSKQLRAHFAVVTGIEWSEGAICHAREDASENETYLAGSVENHILTVLSGVPLDQSTLIVDPPAEGLSPDVVAAILDKPPQTLVYVSCDPSTFARDAKKLSLKYKLDSVQPVDMFPQTAEIELAARFLRI
jgi:23S rRNA (uracil1939-C5)-methyltransferase